MFRAVFFFVGAWITTAVVAQQTPWNATPFAIPGTIQAEQYDRGGEGVAYHDTTPGNVFGTFRTDGMDVGAIPGGGHHIGFVDGGEWAEYTVNIPVTQPYDIRLRVASASPLSNTFHLELNGTPITGTLSVANSGNWQAYSILTVPQVTLSAGSNRVLRVAFDTGAFNLDWIEIRGQTPWGSAPAAIPGRIQAENYDRGDEGLAYHDTTPGNVFGTYRTDSMDVGPIAGGGHHIGFLDNGEWAEYTVNVSQSGNYELRLRYASASTLPMRFRVLLGSTNLTGTQSLTSTGSWSNFIVKTIPVTLSAGNNRILRFAFDVGAWNLDWFELVRVTGQTPWGSSPAAVPGRIQAENYDRGSEGVAYHDTTPGNVFGAYRTDSMDVGAIPAGGFHIGLVEAGEWAEYTVNVGQTGAYELRLRHASAVPGNARLRFLLNGTDLAGTRTFASTGAWHNYRLTTVPVTLTAGNNRVLRVTFDAGSLNLDWLELVRVTCSTPTITQQPASQTASVGATVTFTAAASGAPTPSLQWTKDGQTIAGATSPSLTLTNVQTGDAGSYRLRATNSCGSATSNAATLTVGLPGCGGNPSGVVRELGRALQGQGAVCDWVGEMDPGFPNSMGDGSFNLPVLAAAVALIREPIRNGQWNMYTWWDSYLRGELGERGTQWAYGGKELTSGVYQHYNIISVMAVHYEAHRRGRTTMRDQARRWLRATFAIHALSATPAPPRTFHDRGRIDRFVFTGYSGPWLALAGMRSSEDWWPSLRRAILFARASGLSSTLSPEGTEQATVRNFLEGAWNGPGGSVYGLTAQDGTDLRAVLGGTVRPSVLGMLAGLRTITRIHFVGWPGVRVTLIERNANGNTAPTYGFAYFNAPRDANGREAHVLYPWTRASGGSRPFRHGITAGSASLDLLKRSMEATNAPGSSTHPAVTVRIQDLPAGPPQFHVTLDP